MVCGEKKYANVTSVKACHTRPYVGDTLVGPQGTVCTGSRVPGLRVGVTACRVELIAPGNRVGTGVIKETLLQGN